MKRGLLALTLVLTLVGASSVFASTPLPEPTGYVNDFAAVMSAEAKATLEQELVQFNASTTNEIAVVTVTSMNGDYIEHYAPALFKLWGIGTDKNDNGVLLLLTMSERKVRIEVGYGLEGALPDSVAASIIADITPLLKNNDYDGALALGAQEIMEATQGEYQGSGTTSDAFDPEAFFPIFIFGIFALQWILAVLSRSKSYWAGGVLGAVAGAGLASIFGWWVMGGAILTGGLVLLGLALDFAVSQAYSTAKSSGIHPPWWTGGTGGFGGGSSSGGFGGFGGGSSGGGGASGSF